MPRWLQIGGVLLAVAVLVLVLATKLTGSPDRNSALPTPTPTVTDGPTPSPAFDPARALDVVLGQDYQWSIEGDRLIRSQLDDKVKVRTLPIGFLHPPVTSTPVLALDEAHHRIWVVVANVPRPVMVEVDTESVRIVRTSSWKQLVYGAAAVNGYLYLSTALGVAELSPERAHPRLLPGLSGVFGPVAADPVHSQMIALDTYNTTAVYSFRHGELPRESELRLPLVKGTLAVSGGDIWAGGFGSRGAMLYRIDPETLLPVEGGRAPRFDPGVVLVAGGRSVIWARQGYPDSDLLVCIDARSGDVEQQFHLLGGGAVDSTGGWAVIASAQGVLPLSLDGCEG